MSGSTAIPPISGDRNAKLFVWGVWLAMLITALVFIVIYGRNIPYAEDWYMVAPLTGNEANLGSWLWAQNSEHRIPLPRLILLILLKLTHGNFRSCMVFNVLISALVAAAAILVSRYLRQGSTSYTDAFFPLALLNIGHWPNFYWSWQLTFVLPTALTYTLLFVLIIQPSITSTLAATIAGISLVLLPFCGANGLFFVPFIMTWLIYRGVANWYTTNYQDKQQRRASLISIIFSVIALCLVRVYFIGFQPSPWNTASPSFAATLLTSARFLSYIFGAASAVYSLRSVLVLVAFGILIPTLVIVILAVVHSRGFERQRALAILLFCSVFGLFSLAMGYGRSGLITFQGFPTRYAIFAVPLLCLAFFIWELYGQRKWQKKVQWALFLGLCILLPFNTIAGFERFGNGYNYVMTTVSGDIEAGVPISELARRHHKLLIHWWEKEKVEANMQMLVKSRVEPFDRVPEDKVSP